MSGFLTKEFLKANTVIFFPASAGEAKFIQKRLFALDVGWTHKGKTLIDTGPSLANGMIVIKGTLYDLGDSDFNNTAKAVVGDVRALSPSIDIATLALDARIQALEKQVKDLTALLGPKKLDKQTLKKASVPKAGAA